MALYRRHVSTFPPSLYSDNELLGVVGDVCRTARSDAPVETTQREFNAARAAAGHPHAPTAARICTRLKMGWEDVKLAALDRKRNHVQTVSAQTRAKTGPWLSKETCVFALRRVADRRGVSELSREEYDATAGELRRESSRRWVHGDRIVIPTSAQIATCFKSWAAALKAAGLSEHARIDTPQGLGYVDALELALETKGALPTSDELDIFIRTACRLQLVRPQRQKITHPWAVGELRRRRTVLGKWTPSGYPPKPLRPDWSELVEGIAGPSRVVRDLSEELCVQYLMRFLLESHRESRSAYAAWSVRTEGAPSPSSMGRAGRRQFAALRAEARARLRSGEQPSV